MTDSYNIDLSSPDGRERWLDLRRRDIGASDVAAICGFHPNRTPMHVYAQKLGKLESEDNNIMRRGRWLEPAILAALGEQRPDLRVWQPKTYIRDPELRLGATLDFVADDLEKCHWAIEGKVVARPEFLKHWIGEPIDEEPIDEDLRHAALEIRAPIWFQLQALTQAKLRKADKAAVAALVIDTWTAELEIAEVPLVDTAWNFVKERVAAFWKRFDAGQPPDLDPARDARAIAALYPSDDGSEIDLSDNWKALGLIIEWDSLDEHRRAVNAVQKPNDDRIQEIKTSLRSMIGNAACARLPGWSVTLKTQHRKAVEATSYRVMRKKRIA
jgi:hypothetical protein